MSYPYLGYLKLNLDKFLKDIQLEVYIFNTSWDTKIWPHCSKGFFKLKKNIPQLLSEYI